MGKRESGQDPLRYLQEDKKRQKVDDHGYQGTKLKELSPLYSTSDSRGVSKKSGKLREIRCDNQQYIADKIKDLI